MEQFLTSSDVSFMTKLLQLNPKQLCVADHCCKVVEVPTVYQLRVAEAN